MVDQHQGLHSGTQFDRNYRDRERSGNPLFIFRERMALLRRGESFAGFFQKSRQLLEFLR